MEICKNDLDYACEESLLKARIEGIPDSEKVYVAVVNNEVAGFVQVQIYEPIYFETMVNVLGLAVANKYRRQGIGKMLMSKVECWASEIDVKYVRLNSGSERKSAHEFYHTLGYGSDKVQVRLIKKI